MGFFVPDNLGNLITVSIDEHLEGGIEYNDQVLFDAIIASPNDYKWRNDTIQHFPRPSMYHAWNGTAWVSSQKLIDDARATIWERIKEYRQQRQYMGVLVTINENDYWIHSDESSRSLHLGLVGAAILHIMRSFLGVLAVPLFPSGLQWKTMQTDTNGNPLFIPLDWVAALQIFAADQSMTSLCFMRAEIHRMSLMYHPDPLNYNYTTGWPPVYGE